MEASTLSIVSVPGIPTAERVADLERKIAFRTAGRIRGLRIESAGPLVILSGRTSTYYVKQLASQIALDEECDLTLQNAIEVI